MPNDALPRNDAHLSRLLDLTRTMARIRAFEEAAEAAQKEGLVKGAVHLSRFTRRALTPAEFTGVQGR